MSVEAVDGYFNNANRTDVPIFRQIVQSAKAGVLI